MSEPSDKNASGSTYRIPETVEYASIAAGMFNPSRKQKMTIPIESNVFMPRNSSFAFKVSNSVTPVSNVPVLP